MLTALAIDSGWLQLRGAMAMAFGLAVLLWPGLRLETLVMLFGAYALLDGVTALAIATSVASLGGVGVLVFEGLVRVCAGFSAFAYPETVVTLPRFIAACAALTGIAEFAVAGVLRRELTGEWPLPFAGVLSMVIAVLLAWSPADVDATAVRWLVGPYGLIFGTALVVLARRLRQLAQEMANA